MERYDPRNVIPAFLLLGTQGQCVKKGGVPLDIMPARVVI